MAWVIELVKDGFALIGVYVVFTHARFWIRTREDR